MPDDEIKISPTGEKIYRPKKLPKKFCPYCGHRNEPYAEKCENCDKDISWMRIPEEVPGVDEPKLPPKSPPKQRQAFTRWQVVVIWIVVVLLIAAIATIIVLATRNESEQETESLRTPAGRVVVSTAEPPMEVSNWDQTTPDQALAIGTPSFREA